MPRGEIGAHRVAPPAYFVPGVRRHVIDMAGARIECPGTRRMPLPGPARWWTRWRARRWQAPGCRTREDTLEQLVQTMNVRVVHVPRAAARLERRARRRRAWRSRDRLDNAPTLSAWRRHRRDPARLACRVEFLDIPHRHGVDEIALFGRGAAFSVRFCAAA